MNIRDAINRGNNLFAVGLLAIAGFAQASEMFGENRFLFKADDIAMFVLAIIAIIWYFTGRNRYLHSYVPMVLLGLALLAKFFGLIVEFANDEAVGDDLGLLPAIVLGLIVIGWLYYRRSGIKAARAGGEGTKPV